MRAGLGGVDFRPCFEYILLYTKKGRIKEWKLRCPSLRYESMGGEGGSVLHLRRRNRTISHVRNSLGQDKIFEELLDLGARAPNAENISNAENRKSFIRSM